MVNYTSIGQLTNQVGSQLCRILVRAPAYLSAYSFAPSVGLEFGVSSIAGSELT